MAYKKEEEYLEDSDFKITIYEINKDGKNKLPNYKEINNQIKKNLSTSQLIIANQLDTKLKDENIKIDRNSVEIKETNNKITYTALTKDKKIFTYVYDLESEKSGVNNVEVSSVKFSIG